MIMRYTDRTANVFAKAYEVALSYDQDYVSTEHLIAGILAESEGKAYEALTAQGIDKDNFKAALDRVNGKESRNIEVTTPETMENIMQVLTPRTKRVLEISIVEAEQHRSKAVEPEHLLAAIIREGESSGYRILKALGTNMRLLYIFIYADVVQKGFTQDPRSNLRSRAFSNLAGARNPSSSNSKYPNLEKYGTNLTSLANEGKLDPVIGREEETNRLMQILVRRTKNNPVLIGEAGVGKTAIVEGLAQLIASANIPEALKEKQIISIDLTSMLAGAKYRGEFEERLENVLNEAMAAENVILFIDELHTIVGTGAGEGTLDASNILKPLLARGKLQIIGATTIDEYRKIIEKDKALERRFQPVMVEEPNEKEAYLILDGIKDKYEAHHGVRITDEAVKAAVEMSARYITDRFLPDKAIDLIDEASAKVRLDNFVEPDEIRELEGQLADVESKKEKAANEEKFEEAAKLRSKELQLQKELDAKRSSWRDDVDSEHNVLTAEDIAEVVSQSSGIPVTKITETDMQRLKNLENDLKKHVIGQDEACEKVARAIKRGRLGLKDPNRPIGSFLFLGTTGVGKTELAKALATELFGSEDAMVRFDMSEYMEKFDVNKFIGSPPGYVGYEESGQLTEAVRRKPYSVVLFDEVEKAHPDVLNVMLQILEDGRLTDGQGRTVDFSNTVIIMTSNLGASVLGTAQGREIGFGSTSKASEASKDLDPETKEYERHLYGGRTYEEAKELILDEVKEEFRPEFINRIDEIVVFHMLGEDSMEAITRNMLKEVDERVQNIGLHIDVSDEVVTYLAETGYNPEYGARPLRRTIQTELEDMLSEALLDGKISEGDTAIVVKNEDGDGLTVKPGDRALQKVSADTDSTDIEAEAADDQDDDDNTSEINID